MFTCHWHLVLDAVVVSDTCHFLPNLHDFRAPVRLPLTVFFRTRTKTTEKCLRYSKKSRDLLPRVECVVKLLAGLCSAYVFLFGCDLQSLANSDSCCKASMVMEALPAFFPGTPLESICFDLSSEVLLSTFDISLLFAPDIGAGNHSGKQSKSRGTAHRSSHSAGSTSV